MAKHAPKPFIIRMQTDGTKTELRGETADVRARALELVKKMPTDPARKQTYVREQVSRMLNGQLDRETFGLFAELGKCWNEVNACAARQIMLHKNKQERR